jgi:hypothetical protein
MLAETRTAEWVDDRPSEVLVQVSSRSLQFDLVSPATAPPTLA